MTEIPSDEQLVRDERVALEIYDGAVRAFAESIPPEGMYLYSPDPATLPSPIAGLMRLNDAVREAHRAASARAWLYEATEEAIRGEG